MPKPTQITVLLIVPVLFLLLLSQMGWAQAASQLQNEPTPTPEPPPPPPPSEWIGTITYSGITLSPSQTPLSGIQISALPLDPTMPGDYGFSTVTDSAGQFNLLLTPTVQYRIWVWFSDISYYYHPDGLKARPEDAAVFTPQFGENRSDLVIQWLEPVTFSGVVIGSNALGIGNINITAEVVSQGQSGPYSTQTQANGNYVLTVPAGQVYRLSASASLPDQPYGREYYQDVIDPAQAVTFDAQAAGVTTFTNVDFQLEELPSFYVSGVIRDENLQPLEGVSIAIQNETKSSEYPLGSQSDALGHYRVRLEPGDLYIFQFYKDGYPSVYYNGSGDPPVYQLAEVISGAAGEERIIDYQYQAPVIFSGRVINQAGDTLEGAVVEAYEKTSGSYMSSVVTQADGTFSLTLPGGYDYALSAGPVYGMNPLRKEYYPDQVYLDTATFFSGVPGTQYTDITFVLDPAFRIQGKVIGPSGSGLAGVPVIVEARYEGGSGSIKQTTTNENGEYQVSILDPVEKVTLYACAECAGYPYGKLYYTASGGLPVSSLAEIIIPQVGQTRAGVDFQFRQPITFSGSVQDTNGNPLEGVTVSVQEVETQQEIARGVTGADGRYTVQAPPGMTMRLAAWPGDPNQRLRWEYYDDQRTWEAAYRFDGQTPGTVYANRNIILEPLPTTYVSGVVRGPDGKPVVGVTVNASPSNWQANHNQATTGADGRYRLVLDAGYPYTILACASCSHMQYSDLYYHDAGNTPIFGNAQVITGTNDQERIGVDFQFSHPVVISGQVTGPDGKPLAGSYVSAEDAAGNAWLGSAQTDLQGRYTLYLEPGYPLRVSVSPYLGDANLARIYYPNQFRASQARIFEGGPGDRFESIDFRVEQVLTITGRVISPNGVPLSSVRVECEQDGENPSCGRAYTNSMGVYSLKVQPGQPFRIFAGGHKVNGLVYSRIYSNGTPLRSKAETLIGGTGETLRGVDFHLIPAVSVSGHVYAPDASPLKGIWVTVLGEDNRDELGEATTTADGSYTAYIHPGLSYMLKADPGSKPYPMEYYNDAPNRAQAVILSGDNRRGLDFTFNPPAVLRGHVTLSDGSPIFLPSVTALDVTSGEVLSYSASAEDGSYTMYLRSGHAYHVQVISNPYLRDFLVEYWENRHTRAQAAVVQMGAPGTERVLNLQVDPVAVAAQAATVDQPFTYTIPDAGPDLTFRAELANGGDLPAWLHFNPTTRTFNGTPTPADEGKLNVMLIVSYDAGRQVVRTFILEVSITVSIFLPLVRR